MLRMVLGSGVHHPPGADSVFLTLTGHSLGGALACLAAFDIQRMCPCLGPLDVACYTFGAPRVGNHAFARQYDATVPDTWSIINDQVGACRLTSAQDLACAS